MGQFSRVQWAIGVRDPDRRLKPSQGHISAYYIPLWPVYFVWISKQLDSDTRQGLDFPNFELNSVDFNWQLIPLFKC
jgi:hypothetical protein